MIYISLIFLYVAFRLILSQYKDIMNNDSLLDDSLLDDSLLDDSETFDSFDDSLLDGGLRYPISIINWFRTCFIDSVLNSIANSETLTNYFNSIISNNKFTDDQMINMFIIGMPRKAIISSLITKEYKSNNNKLELYKILCGIFIRGIDKQYSNEVMLYITLYIMYLENEYGFNKRYKSKTKILNPTDSFYDYVCNADYNFICYFNYCQKPKNKNNSEFTGVLNNMLIRKLGLKHIICECEDVKIQTELNNNNETDLFVEIIYTPVKYNESVVNDMFKTCIKTYEGKYRCTDMILDKYEKYADIAYHSVYYNIDKGLLHDDGKIMNVSIDILHKSLEDGDYYAPCILHFQLK